MIIKWIGHSSFLLTSASGSTLLTDPYDISAYPDSLFYEPVNEAPDVVISSHGHADHGNVEAIGGAPLVITTVEPHAAAGFTIRGVPTFHDAELGAKKGGNIVYCIEVDDLTICHLGDLGHELTPEQAAGIGAVDVLMIPVGGTFTIDAAAATRVWRQLNPAIVLPMHYRNEKCAFTIDGVDAFLAGKNNVEIAETSEVEVMKENLPANPKIIVLKPAN